MPRFPLHPSLGLVLLMMPLTWIVAFVHSFVMRTKRWLVSVPPQPFGPPLLRLLCFNVLINSAIHNTVHSASPPPISCIRLIGTLPSLIRKIAPHAAKAGQLQVHKAEPSSLPRKN